MPNKKWFNFEKSTFLTVLIKENVIISSIHTVHVQKVYKYTYLEFNLILFYGKNFGFIVCLIYRNYITWMLIEDES